MYRRYSSNSNLSTDLSTDLSICVVADDERQEAGREVSRCARCHATMPLARLHAPSVLASQSCDICTLAPRSNAPTACWGLCPAGACVGACAAPLACTCHGSLAPACSRLARESSSSHTCAAVLSREHSWLLVRLLSAGPPEPNHVSVGSNIAARPSGLGSAGGPRSRSVNARPICRGRPTDLSIPKSVAKICRRPGKFSATWQKTRNDVKQRTHWVCRRGFTCG